MGAKWFKLTWNHGFQGTNSSCSSVARNLASKNRWADAQNKGFRLYYPQRKLDLRHVSPKYF